MENARVRGELFQEVVEYIHKKWGTDGLKVLGVDLEQYLPDAWYDLEEFCELLDGLFGKMGIKDPNEPFKIGKWMVTRNARWAAVFKGKNPDEVFSSNKNQQLEYVVGEFKGIHSSIREVSIHSTIWTTDKRHLDLWCEFYRGRLQGVLDLTGRRGEVGTVSEMLEEEATCTYRITWV